MVTAQQVRNNIKELLTLFEYMFEEENVPLPQTAVVLFFKNELELTPQNLLFVAADISDGMQEIFRALVHPSLATGKPIPATRPTVLTVMLTASFFSVANVYINYELAKIHAFKDPDKLLPELNKMVNTAMGTVRAYRAQEYGENVPQVLH